VFEAFGRRDPRDETNASPRAIAAIIPPGTMPRQFRHRRQGAIAMETIDEHALEAGWVRWRHDFHRFPETGFNERGTSDRVAQVLQMLGLEVRMRELCEGICRAHGATCTVEYTHEFAPTVNWPQCVPWAVRAAQAVAGAGRVDADTPPMMISGDFGRFLQHIPGAFVFIGNGDGDDPGAVPLHNARYDFNDRIVPAGARWFAELVRQRLPATPRD
jgi:metal-dependent amidase/aminoacylase/carboxypeptidase family protein